MNTFAVFLRGVNVGGNAIINMKEFVLLQENNNYTGARSYINSGNITFQSKKTSSAVSKNIKKLIIENYSFPVEVIVKTKSELDEIINNSPYKDDESDFSKRVVALLSGDLSEGQESALLNNKNIIEPFYIVKDTIYIYYKNGAGRSKFTNNYIENTIKVVSTLRNWNTLLKMVEIMNTYS